LDDKSICDRKETRYPSDGREYVGSKTSHAEKHCAGNQDDPYNQREPASSAHPDIRHGARRLHGRKISEAIQLCLGPCPTIPHRTPNRIDSVADL
jgi:hypothetical protein